MESSVAMMLRNRRSDHSPWLTTARVSKFFSFSSATSSARLADVSAATMMQMIATATTTQSGTTTPRRARSHAAGFGFSLGSAKPPWRHNRHALLHSSNAATLGGNACYWLDIGCEKAAMRCAHGVHADAFRATALIRRQTVNEILTRRDVGRPRNAHVRRPQRRGPAFAQVVEIGFPRLDPVYQLGIHASRRTTTQSIGRPTPRLERIVESIESRLILSAS